MQTRLSLFTLVLTAVAVLLTSCGKHDVIPDCGAPFCQIQSVSGFDALTQVNSTSTIDYNAAGNPIRRTRSDVSTGSENEQYRYDKLNRLTDQITYYDSGNYGDFFWEWHRFKYDNQGRIYMDSVYMIGTIGDHPLPFPQAPTQHYYIFFEYDTKGRVIKERLYFENNDPWAIREYTYDSRQNLVRKITTSVSYPENSDTTYFPPYDNKVNYLRTNKVWQFLTKDYSQNNTIPAVSYNKYGLPEKFRPGNKFGNTYFLDVQYADLDITYKCK